MIRGRPGLGDTVTPPDPLRSAAVLLCLLCLSALTAASGLRFQPGPWYAALAKPAWTPPNWLFGPVWTVLYAAMAVAAWLVWRRTGVASPALAFYGLQLLLNGLWSWLFFGLHRPGLGMAEIGALVAAVAVTAGLFFRVSVPAGWLMVPYLAWVAFAAALNWALWRLNP